MITMSASASVASTDSDDRCGRAWLWVGRKKRGGRGEAASGLRFDSAVLSGQY
jgi:hypothetical protein